MERLRVGFPLASRSETEDGSRLARPSLPQKAAIDLAIALQEAGIEPVMITDDEGPLQAWCSHAGLKTARIRLPLIDNVREAGADVRQTIERAERVRRAQIPGLRLDIVHTNEPRTHITWANVCRTYGIAHVWHERSDFHYPDWAADELGAAGAVLAGSQLLSRRAPPLVRDRVEVIPGVFAFTHDLSKSEARNHLRRLTGHGSARHVIFAGDTKDLKNARLALQAARLAAAIRDDLVFCVAGEIGGWKWPSIRDASLTGPMSGRWIELGYRRDFDALVAGADIVVPLSIGAENVQRVMAAGLYGRTPALLPERQDVTAEFAKAFPACMVAPWSSKTIAGGIVLMDVAAAAFSAGAPAFAARFAQRHSGRATVERLKAIYAGLAGREEGRA